MQQEQQSNNYINPRPSRRAFIKFITLSSKSASHETDHSQILNFDLDISSSVNQEEEEVLLPVKHCFESSSSRGDVKRRCAIEQLANNCYHDPLIIHHSDIINNNKRKPEPTIMQLNELKSRIPQLISSHLSSHSSFAQDDSTTAEVPTSSPSSESASSRTAASQQRRLGHMNRCRWQHQLIISNATLQLLASALFLVILITPVLSGMHLIIPLFCLLNCQSI